MWELLTYGLQYKTKRIGKHDASGQLFTYKKFGSYVWKEEANATACLFEMMVCCLFSAFGVCIDRLYLYIYHCVKILGTTLSIVVLSRENNISKQV